MESGRKACTMQRSGRRCEEPVDGCRESSAKNKARQDETARSWSDSGTAGGKRTGHDRCDQARQTDS